MQIKKYQNTPGRLLKPIAASDMTYKVAAMPLRQQRNDVELLTLNTNRMRSTDAKEREAGRKAEVQRRKQKRLIAKQTANPHVDVESIPDNQFAMNIGDAVIELQVAEEAERNNPYGFYRRSFDPNSPLYQGAITGLSDAEAEERMGFFANLGDALGTTNARHDPNRSLAARLADLMLWNLDIRNPRSGETYFGITAPLLIATLPATTTYYGIGSILSGVGGAELFNHLTYPFTGKTVGLYLGDYFPVLTSTAGNNIVTFTGGIGGYKWYDGAVRRGVETAMRTTSAPSPVNEVKRGFYDTFHPNDGKFQITKRGADRINYILTGHRSKTPGYDTWSNDPAINIENGTIEPYRFTGLISKNDTGINANFHAQKGYGDIIDAYLYGKELDPRIAIKVDHGYGVHTKYILSKYKDKHVPVYELNEEPIVDGKKGISADIETPQNVSDDLRNISLIAPSGQNHAVNVAGHLKLSTPINGVSHTARLDIWKFDPDAYITKWLKDGKHIYTTSQKDYPLLLKIGLNIVNDIGTLLILKTKWYENPFNGYKSGLTL